MSTKSKVKQRDNYRCQICGDYHGKRYNTGVTVEVHAHHIIPKSEGGTNTPDNLTTLCDFCHDVVHPQKWMYQFGKKGTPKNMNWIRNTFDKYIKHLLPIKQKKIQRKKSKLLIQIVVIFICVFLISGCVKKIPESTNKLKEPLERITETFTNTWDESRLIKGVANLPLADVESVTTYHEFADYSNLLIGELGRDGWFDLQKLEGSEKEYKEISKVITEWTPLLGNYNEVVLAARNYDENNEHSSKEFYKAAGIFTVELALILSATYYKVAFKAVGWLYQKSGLTTVAFHHPEIVSFVLSKAHWSIRKFLVDSSSEFIDQLITYIENIVSSER